MNQPFTERPGYRRFDWDRVAANQRIVTQIYDLPDQHEPVEQEQDRPSGAALAMRWGVLCLLFMALGYGAGKLIEGALR